MKVLNPYLDKNITHPVEIMKYLQSQLVQGRALDVSDVSNVNDGWAAEVCKTIFDLR